MMENDGDRKLGDPSRTSKNQLISHLNWLTRLKLHRMALIGTAVGSVPSPENQCNDGAPVPVFSKISDSFSRKGTHGTLPG